jgi:hypothetical protein
MHPLLDEPKEYPHCCCEWRWCSAPIDVVGVILGVVQRLLVCPSLKGELRPDNLARSLCPLLSGIVSLVVVASVSRFLL